MKQLDALRHAISDVLRPGHFFAAPALPLEWQHEPREETPWEVFRGRLSPRHLSGQSAVFESWNVFLRQDGDRSGEPLLSLKLDWERRQLHVVRGLLCWTWEGYHAGDNVYLSREVPRWLRELVGSVDLAECDAGQLREELALWLFRAVVGLSRLPLTSVEAPLPAFTLGELAYFYNPDCQGETRPLESWRQLLGNPSRTLALAARTKWLEFLLRATPVLEIRELAAAYVQQVRRLHHGAGDTFALLRAVFNEVALSPYTDFVDNVLSVLRHWVELQYASAEEHIDFLSFLLRQLARHLTAYDLVTFHHRGANYPDALLLDAALTEYLRLVEQQPALFEGEARPARLRRRALRLAWLHRRRYEGHPVPDAPTSPGENMRVLPPPFARVPDEQILNPSKRNKRLYEKDPLPTYVGRQGQGVLEQCGRDLQNVDEVRELGMAIFIERPLGAVKAPGEPDLSPLLAHEAFSRAVAEAALGELGREPLLGLSSKDITRCRAVLAEPWPSGGIAANTLPTDPPRVVSLADAAKAANDFVILRTLPGSVRAFCARPDMSALLQGQGIDLENEASRWLVVCSVTAMGKPAVLICETSKQLSLEFEVNAAQGVEICCDQPRS
jgi:hypothetical protein